MSNPGSVLCAPMLSILFYFASLFLVHCRVGGLCPHCLWTQRGRSVRSEPCWPKVLSGLTGASTLRLGSFLVSPERLRPLLM